MRNFFKVKSQRKAEETLWEKGWEEEKVTKFLLSGGFVD